MTVVDSGTVIELAFELSTEDEILDFALEADPYECPFDDPKLLPGARELLRGRKVGDEVEGWLDPTLGFGEPNEELRLKIAARKLPEHVRALEVGDGFEGKGPKGEKVFFRLIHKDEKSFEFDGNHPLAGVMLHFRAKILGCRTG